MVTLLPNASPSPEPPLRINLLQLIEAVSGASWPDTDAIMRQLGLREHQWDAADYESAFETTDHKAAHVTYNTLADVRPCRTPAPFTDPAAIVDEADATLRLLKGEGPVEMPCGHAGTVTYHTAAQRVRPDDPRQQQKEVAIKGCEDLIAGRPMRGLVFTAQHRLEQLRVRLKEDDLPSSRWRYTCVETAERASTTFSDTAPTKGGFSCLRPPSSSPSPSPQRDQGTPSPSPLLPSTAALPDAPFVVPPPSVTSPRTPKQDVCVAEAAQQALADPQPPAAPQAAAEEGTPNQAAADAEGPAKEWNKPTGDGSRGELTPGRPVTAPWRLCMGEHPRCTRGPHSQSPHQQQPIHHRPATRDPHGRQPHHQQQRIHRTPTTPGGQHTRDSHHHQQHPLPSCIARTQPRSPRQLVCVSGEVDEGWYKNPHMGCWEWWERSETAPNVYEVRAAYQDVSMTAKALARGAADGVEAAVRACVRGVKAALRHRQPKWAKQNILRYA
ncbi:unnamed protein product [Vitrella brassicaformis CCMP3155]|uniref:Uncharacterized protein n=1 Tax=Vitrella brassicaformis (strain CCMP3155) TaxID=1169540 RepID=A0A0G4GV20_VITBC|nr:unnamed protein product [Vitrella brassicaformis CCMP3155]|eukprot:CEM34743.1 unnamed protein product [Vitrella brassicaformis CCMP3155]